MPRFSIRALSSATKSTPAPLGYRAEPAGRHTSSTSCWPPHSNPRTCGDGPTAGPRSACRRQNCASAWFAAFTRLRLVGSRSRIQSRSPANDSEVHASGTETPRAAHSAASNSCSGRRGSVSSSFSASVRSRAWCNAVVTRLSLSMGSAVTTTTSSVCGIHMYRTCRWRARRMACPALTASTPVNTMVCSRNA